MVLCGCYSGLVALGDVTVMAAVLLSCNSFYYCDVAMVQVLLLCIQLCCYGAGVVAVYTVVLLSCRCCCCGHSCVAMVQVLLLWDLSFCSWG